MDGNNGARRTRRPRVSLFTVWASALGAVLVTAPAAALDLTPRDVGIRAGASLNPDQVVAGVDAQIGRGVRLRFRPVAEVGLGNGVRLITFSADVLYRLGDAGKRFRPYVGAGPGLNLIDVTDGVGEARGMEAEVAANLLGGVTWGGTRVRNRPTRRYLAEVRLGVGDTPDLKVMLGASF